VRSFGYRGLCWGRQSSAMPVRIYAHLSWTCWARLPLIDQAVASFLAPFLLAEAKRHGARVIEIGIVSNHVHLLLELPAAYDVPRLVQGLKGASARLANRDGHSRNKSLRWEAGYDLRSVGVRQLPQVAAYVRDQELKHGSPRPTRQPASP
jgi:REP-associated tyrosine transposase